MKTLKFKTNIKCDGCISTITPFLNGAKGIEKWAVDVTVPEKILSVTTDNLSAEYIEMILQKAGYKAEEIS